MSLDSDDDDDDVSNPDVSDKVEEKQNTLPPPPQSEAFRPPLPDPSVQDPLSSLPVDYNALKTAISEYKASRQSCTSSAEVEDSLANFGVNPHQSYLFPSSTQWSPYSGSPGYHVGSAYSSPACSASQGQEFNQHSMMSLTQANTVPLSQPAALPQVNPGALTPTKMSTVPPAILANLALANPPPLPMLQSSTSSLGEALQVPEVSSGVQAQTDDTVVALPSRISQDVHSKPTESTPMTINSTLPSSSLPNYPEPSIYPALTPIPPLPPPMYNWAPAPGAQQSYPPGVNLGPFGPPPSTQNEVAGTLAAPGMTDKLWAGAGTGGMPNSMVESRTSGAAPSTVPMKEPSLEKVSTPSIQDNRTPLNSCPESQGDGPIQAKAGGSASSRGGVATPRGLLPIPGVTMGAVCRGGLQGIGSHSSGNTYGPRGHMPGPMDIMRGGFRGRGAPPMPMRSRPGRGPMRFGSVCNWGFPPGRGGGGVPDYYSDYTYP